MGPMCLCRASGVDADARTDHDDDVPSLETMIKSYNGNRVKHFSFNDNIKLPENSLLEDGSFRFSGTLDDVKNILKSI